MQTWGKVVPGSGWPRMRMLHEWLGQGLQDVVAARRSADSRSRYQRTTGGRLVGGRRRRGSDGVLDATESGRTGLAAAHWKLALSPLDWTTPNRLYRHWKIRIDVPEPQRIPVDSNCPSNRRPVTECVPPSLSQVAAAAPSAGTLPPPCT